MSEPSTHDEILATWLEEHGDLEMVLFKHKLSPAQLRDFVADPLVIATMDAHEALLARRRRILASMHMQNAAEMLSKSMFESNSLIESRRAATALARLTRDMTRNASPAPGGGGGRVREAGGGARDLAAPLQSVDTAPTPKETTAQAVAPLPLPVALNGERCPKGGEGSSVDPHPTKSAPITPTAPNCEPGRVAPKFPLAVPVALNGERCPKGGEGSSVDPHPTKNAPTTPTAPNREPGRVAPKFPLAVPVALNGETSPMDGEGSSLDLQPTKSAEIARKADNRTPSASKETTERAVAPITAPVVRTAETCSKDRNGTSQPRQTTTNASHPRAPITPLSEPLEAHPIPHQLLEMRGP